jgi:hypothetical protein
LIAIPLLFVAEDALDRLCREAVSNFAEGGLARSRESEPMRPILLRAARWRDYALAEGLLLALVYAFHLGIWETTGKAAGLLSEATGAAAWSPALAWYGFVGLPVFNFLLLRSLYHWALWSGILLKLSRFELRTTPTHPDNAGGLEPLAEPTLGFSFVLMGMSAVVAAVWGTHVLQRGVSARTYLDQFALLVALGEIAALAPLLAFTAGLLRTRLKGMTRYGRLALVYTRAFHERWIESRKTEGLLGSADIQSLADLSNSFEVIKRMRLVPFGLRHALVVFAAIALPMFPLVLTEIGIDELITGVGRALIPGLPE